MSGFGTVLTLTYGNLSCKLEGFEDPLPTLFAVTQYFREIAARETGLVPRPVPADLPALEHLVERVVSAPVSGEISGSGVILRASLPDRGKTVKNAAEAGAWGGAAGTDGLPTRLREVVAHFHIDHAEAARPEVGNPELGKPRPPALLLGTPSAELSDRSGLATKPAAPPPTAPEGAQPDPADPRDSFASAAQPAAGVLVLTGAVEPTADPTLVGSAPVEQNAQGRLQQAAGVQHLHDPARKAHSPETAGSGDAFSSQAGPSPGQATGSATSDQGASGAAAGRDLRDGSASLQEASLERLMLHANSEFDGPEHRRRLSAISHLKAAVAVTEAEKRQDRAEAGQRPTQLERFRDDLAKAVRPRQLPQDPGASPDQTGPDGVDRLILAHDRRIDLHHQAMGQPLQRNPPLPAPAAADDDGPANDDQAGHDDDDYAEITTPDDNSFGAFAARIGAQSLCDLLEAAAAHAAYVEGHVNFSRPHIMRKVVAHAAGQGISREDGLRSFGTLLREGKIHKVDRGQFALAPTSRFIPEAQRGAG